MEKLYKTKDGRSAAKHLVYVENTGDMVIGCFLIAVAAALYLHPDVWEISIPFALSGVICIIKGFFEKPIVYKVALFPEKRFGIKADWHYL
ncbi:MAG: hypothetical protein IJA73_03525 [Oscillospiraceae bacterium]|nr:hypothetical protein [Oscillospiraceae bacterium]